MGLAAADGVASALGADGVGFGLMDLPGVPKSPIVPAAILYDLANGGDKDWGEAPPYRALGRAGLRHPRPDRRPRRIRRPGMGRVQAPKLAVWAPPAPYRLPAGQLARSPPSIASARRACPGAMLFGPGPMNKRAEFGGARPPADFRLDLEDWGDAKANPAPRANTTIACVATDLALSVGEAQRVAQMALSGFSRAIRPVFAPFDGDVVFVMSTGAVELAEPKPMTLARLGEVAAACLARSIARGVYERSRSEA